MPRKNTPNIKPPLQFVRFNLLYTAILSCMIWLSMYSCSNSIHDGKSHQGTIVYDITFPDQKQSIIMDLYPKEMKFHFKGHMMHSEIKSSYDLLVSHLIVDSENKTLTQLLKNMSERTGVQLDEEATKQWLEQYPELRFQSTNETLVIAGYTCNKTIAHFAGDSLPPIELYHTKGLGLETNNWWNPFRGLDGFLLGYDLEQLGMRMRLRARVIRFEGVNDQQFGVPKDYKLVTPDKMMEQIKSIAKEYI